MAKKTSKERRAAAARASQIERSKGTSKKDLHSQGKDKAAGRKSGNKKKAVIICAIAVLAVAAIAFSLWFFVFRDKEDVPEGITYVYNAELGGYEIKMTDKAVTTVTIPDEIDGIPVVAIAKGGFAGCAKLTSISIPDTVEYIGAGAFSGCESLGFTEYNNGKYLGNSGNPYLVLVTVRNDEQLTAYQTEASTKIIYDYAFGELEYMNYVIITDNVKQIGVGAFAMCKELAQITILPGTEYIGDYAFYSCEKLTTVAFSGADPSIGAYAFASCKSLLNVTLPYAMTEVSDGMFKDTGIIALNIPDTVTRIGKYAFSGCTSLNMPTFPSKLESIDSYAFQSCFASSKAEIELSLADSNIKHIGAYAFKECTGLGMVNLPKTLCDLGNGAFSGCGGMTVFSIDAEAPITYLPTAVLENCTKLVVVSLSNAISSYGDYSFYGCTALQTIPVTDTLKSIGAGAFGMCTALTAAVIPNSVTALGESVFRGSSLVSVTLPENLTGIPSYAFSACKKLKNIYINNGGSNNENIIPATVKSIGTDAFYNCEALESLTLPSGLASIADGAFDGCTRLTLAELPETLTDLGYISEETLFSGYDTLDSFHKALGSSFTYTEYEGGLYAGTAENPYMIFVGLKDTSATEITLHADTRVIASGAFYYASTLKAAALPSGLKVIGSYAFGKCTALASIEIPSTVSVMMNGAFYGCKALTSVNIPSVLTALPDYAFYDCEKLKSIVLPDGLETVGLSAFYNCAALTKAEFGGEPDGLANAFYGCDDYEYTTDGGVLYLGNAENPYLVLVEAADKTITSYTVKDGTKYIHASAFYGCRSLTAVSIPQTVIQIGSGAFVGCTALTSVSLPSGVTRIAMGTFAECTALTSVSAPGVTVIDDGNSYYATSGAFAGCTALTSLVTGGLESIGVYAFYGCTSLVSLELTDMLTSIGSYAFCGCTSLERMRIPSSVTKVGYNVFDGCTALGTVEIGAAYEHAGFDPAWLDQSSVDMTNYIHVKRGA